MSKEEKESRTITLKITFPTKEAIVKKLTELFPALEVKAEEEKEEAEAITEEEAEEIVEETTTEKGGE
jgi:endonuclease V-like protein UPF0215 family